MHWYRKSAALVDITLYLLLYIWRLFINTACLNRPHRMCPIADATLFPEVHTLNGRMYKTALQLPSVGGDVSREAVLARSSCVYTKNV